MGDWRDMCGPGSELSASTETSRGLIQRVQAADPVAWDRLVHLYGPLVLGWCRYFGLKDDDVADVFQEVFASVAANIGRFHKDRPGDTFRGWLRTITRNKVHDHFRRLGREPGGEGGTEAQVRMSQVAASQVESQSESAPARAEQVAHSDLFQRGLEMIRGEFEERTWHAFWRTAVDGRAPKDVGAELSMSPGAVRVAKSRVLQRLRAELGDLRE
jgi:RNA polymerase sigma-70 factor (ECF subfamily)